MVGGHVHHVQFGDVPLEGRECDAADRSIVVGGDPESADRTGKGLRVEGIGGLKAVRILDLAVRRPSISLAATRDRLV